MSDFDLQNLSGAGSVFLVEFCPLFREGNGSDKVRRIGVGEKWLERHHYRKGATVPPQALYELGRDWYATRFDTDWQPATAVESHALFARHGLTREFWSLT